MHAARAAPKSRGGEKIAAQDRGGIAKMSTLLVQSRPMNDTGSSSHPLELQGEALKRWLDECSAFVLEHLRTLPEQPSFNVEGAGDLAATFREAVPAEGKPLPEILARLKPAFERSLTTAGPGYLAFIPGGGVPAAALADLLACITNRFVNVAAAAPALAQIEATVIEWLARLMGCPEGTGGILTSGGSISNLMAMVAARQAKIPDDAARGRIYLSQETHLSVVKGARIAGFSEESLRWIPVDGRCRMVTSRLQEAIREDTQRGARPFLIIANAGTVNTGAVDPIPDLIEIARRHDLWVHADAAYGGFFRLVSEGAALLPGLELSDSITLDPHKGLFLPYGTGCLLVRLPETLRAALETRAGYLQDVAEGRGIPSFHELSPELSRDFRGLRIWLPFQMHGVPAFQAQLQEKLDLARWAYGELKTDPHFEMLDEPQLSIVACAVRGKGREADARGAEILRRVNQRRKVFLSSTQIDGRYVLRLCILNFRTHRDRVQAAVEGLKEEARAVFAGG
jgi:aromatic-L-amino-acid decarboxylase